MVDEQLVRHIAQLARIGVTDAEIRKFAKELGAILGYVEQLSSVATEGTNPIAHITGRTNAVRGDELPEEGGVLPPNTDCKLLEEQAPGYHDGEVRVPRILE